MLINASIYEEVIDFSESKCLQKLIDVKWSTVTVRGRHRKYDSFVRITRSVKLTGNRHFNINPVLLCRPNIMVLSETDLFMTRTTQTFFLLHAHVLHILLTYQNYKLKLPTFYNNGYSIKYILYIIYTETIVYSIHFYLLLKITGIL